MVAGAGTLTVKARNPHLVGSTVEQARMLTGPPSELEFAVTRPLASTVATVGSSEVQLTVWAGLLVPVTTAEAWSV